MLQFWKKSGHRERNRSNSSSPTKSGPSSSSSVSSGCDPSPCRITYESVSAVPIVSLDDEGLFDIGETEVPKKNSRLSKTLNEVLSDKSALGCFMQYLESRNGLHYLRCWLDIRDYQSVVDEIQRPAKEEILGLRSNVLSSPLFGTKIEHDSLSVSTDCDSYTADTNSLVDCSLITISEDKINNDKTSCIERTLLDINTCDRNVSDISCKYEGGSEKSNNKMSSLLTSDALKIFKTYIALEATDGIKCPENIRKDIIESICNAEKIPDSSFDKVQKYVFDVLEKDYFQAFLASDYFCKHQIDVLTSGDVILEDVLYNETALFYFMEFLEQETNRNLLEFWLAASNFQQQLHDQKDVFDPIEAQNDAVVLYDKYFSLQAHCPLGFSDKIRLAVEQNICGENGLMLDCFHLPLKIIEQILERNYLKPFTTSQLFYKYLSELINAVQSNGYTNTLERNKYSPSECISEKSFCTSSTFLAMENPTRRNKKDRGADMHIDTRQLYDPDSLWKRKKNHRLSFGRITELGRFETDFEPEPDKKLESKLKNVVRRFVNLEESNKKEEMAWQVAEMIVKDITDITLNSQKPLDS